MDQSGIRNLLILYLLQTDPEKGQETGNYESHRFQSVAKDNGGPEEGMQGKMSPSVESWAGRLISDDAASAALLFGGFLQRHKGAKAGSTGIKTPAAVRPIISE